MIILFNNFVVAAIVAISWWQLAERGPSRGGWLFAGTIPLVFAAFLWANWRARLEHASRFWQTIGVVLLAAFMTGAITLAFMTNLPQCPRIEYQEMKD